jgi:heterodisulfide reductase subunit A
LSQEYGLGRYPNVVTSLQLERLLSASGPTKGHVKRPSDGAPAKRIAFLQCVGSRDQSHDYCSAVCCMYAAKEAVMIREHDSEAQVHVFMMDMRAFSKGYEAYYQRARKRYGIEYTRCRISQLREDQPTGDLVLRYAAGLGQADGDNILQPAIHTEEKFDLVVLSVGMEVSESVQALGARLGIELDDYGFCHTPLFDPLQTSRPGIYVAGPFREPKDIPESIVDATGAAAGIAGLLAPARYSLTRTAEFPPERDVSAEPPRVGVFVCHCGSNIGGYLDVPGVAEDASRLPGVVHSEHNLYTCSQDSIAHITEQVKELGLNRVVVASCTPITHAPLFQDSIRAAGLNPGLFEMANIRNQCSWVHSDDREAATQKARQLIRMAVARATTLRPLATSQVAIQQSALVVGGGVAGMTAALSLAAAGYPVELVEKTDRLGGNLRSVFSTVEGPDPQAFLRDLIRRLESEPRITTHLGCQVLGTRGFAGRFTTALRSAQGEEIEVNHGVTILATGGREYRGEEYAYGLNPRVVTGQEFESMLALAAGQVSSLDGQAAVAWKALSDQLPNEAAMLLCVGPASRFCGRTCCATALKNALRLKRLNPQARVTVLYKDIRTYGFKERLYTQARQAGVLFVRYGDDCPPSIQGEGEHLEITVHDPTLGLDLRLRPDLLMLSNPIVPQEDSHQIASLFKVPVDADGFFLEAHVKLRPVDFASDGLFMAGLAHYPKFVDETIVQAQAAAARAGRLLSRSTLTAGGVVATVDPAKCVGCLTCVRVCPFDIPKIVGQQTGVGGIVGAAYIEPTVCQGCGNCVAECPAKAIHLAHYDDNQILVKLDALLVKDESQSYA